MQVIVLNGSINSGKTTTGTALATILPGARFIDGDDHGISRSVPFADMIDRAIVWLTDQIAAATAPILVVAYPLRDSDFALLQTACAARTAPSSSPPLPRRSTSPFPTAAPASSPHGSATASARCTPKATPRARSVTSSSAMSPHRKQPPKPWRTCSPKAKHTCPRPGAAAARQIILRTMTQSSPAPFAGLLSGPKGQITPVK